ncbi:MAG: hypothetical protein ACREU3_07675 [Steroidobacteraceae bacterium]
MSDEKVIPLRPRDEVPRRLERIHSPVPDDPRAAEIPLMIRGDIRWSEICRALAPAGLAAKLDSRLGAIVIMRQEEKRGAN